MKAKFARVLFALFLPVSGISGEGSSYLGNYAWHTGDEGGVDQVVTVIVAQANDKVTTKISVIWTPGAAVEIEGTVPVNQVRAVTVNSLECTEIITPFADNFHNRGIAKVVICGEMATLSLEETSLTESRAVRQYGDYELTKRN